MIVLDASVVIELLLRTPAASRVELRLFSDRESLHAPHLIDVEVAQVVRRYTRGGEITGRRGEEALADLYDLSIERWPHTLLLPRMWAWRNNVTAYDAAYLALAESLDAPLLTLDRKLAGVSGAAVRVELLNGQPAG